MHRRPLGGGRTLAAVGGLVILVGCVLPWWRLEQPGGGGLPPLMGNGLEASGILCLLAGIRLVSRTAIGVIVVVVLAVGLLAAAGAAGMLSASSPTPGPVAAGTSPSPAAVPSASPDPSASGGVEAQPSGHSKDAPDDGGEHPRACAKLKLPGHEAVTERQSVALLEALEDLVRPHDPMMAKREPQPEDRGAREDHRGPDARDGAAVRGRERRHRAQFVP